jgi:chromosome segregation ATPase
MPIEDFRLAAEIAIVVIGVPAMQMVTSFIQSKNDGRRVKIEEHRAEQDDKRVDLEGIRAATDASRELIAQAQSITQSYENRFISLESEMGQLRGNMQTMQNDNEELQTEKKALGERVDALQEENSELRGKVEELTIKTRTFDNLKLQIDKFLSAFEAAMEKTTACRGKTPCAFAGPEMDQAIQAIREIREGKGEV